MADQLFSDADVMGGGQSAPQTFSDADVMGPQPKAPVRGDAANLAAGFNQGVANIAGAPADVASAIMRQGLIPIDPDSSFAKKYPGLAKFFDPDSFKNPALGSESIKHAMGLVGANPEDVQAATPGERIARGVGEGATAALLPTESVPAAIANAGIGAVGGGTGKAVAEGASPGWKPTADVLGNLAGGAGMAGVASGVESAVNLGRQVLQRMFEPAEVTAARKVLGSASDPEAFKAALEKGAPGVIPPNAQGEGEMNLIGSKPTTFQATGDLGVGTYERAVNQSPEGRAAFTGRAEDQNIARRDAIEGIPDPASDPASDSGAVSTYLKGRLSDLQTEHATNVASASDHAAQAIDAMGGDSLENRSAYGEALRGNLDSINAGQKAKESALWKAIDPDGKLPVDPTPIKNGFDDIYGGMSTAEKPPQGEEAAIKDWVDGAAERMRTDDPDKTNIGDLVKLRGRITTAMREERRASAGESPALHRMNDALGVVDDTLMGRADQVAKDAAASGDTSLFDRLKAEHDEWSAGRAGSRPGTAAKPGNGTAPGAISPMAGAEGATAREAGLPAGDKSVPGAAAEEDLTGQSPHLLNTEGNAAVAEPAPANAPNDADASSFPERWAAARTATAQRKGTFKSGPVGAVLKPQGAFGQFQMNASNVPPRLFESPEGLRSFLKAADTGEGGRGIMGDYAAHSLRQAALKNGFLDRAKYGKWMADHSYAFDQMPELRPKFQNAGAAQETLDNSLAAQKSALKDYQDSAARHVLNNEDPVKAVGIAMKRPEDMADLVRLTAGNKAAQAGLRRAAIEHMMNTVESKAEVGTSGVRGLKIDRFQRFVDDNRLSLSKLFSPDQLTTMQAVANDLARSNRSITGVKMPGASNSAQDISKMMEGGKRTLLQAFIMDKGLSVAGHAVGHPWLGHVAGLVGGVLRMAQMANAKDAITELMLDPNKARAALARIPVSAPSAAGANFAARMRSLTANELARAATGG